jgi:hypothetical protein
MRQGLPQGSVLAPLLFVLFAQDLPARIPDNVTILQYADDVALLASDRDLTIAAQRVQQGIDSVAEWSERKKQTLNVGKTEACFFSSSSRDARWTPALRLNGRPITYNPTPKFLGVILSRTLSFAEHVGDVCTRVRQRNRVLMCLAGRDWGWRKESMLRTYQALQQSVLTYAAAAWMPFLSESRLLELDRAQNSALRVVTGQLRSSPLEALRLEAGVQSIPTLRDRIVATSVEKALRLPWDHPRRAAWVPEVRHRLGRSSWRQLGRRLLQESQDQDNARDPLPPPRNVRGEGERDPGQ